jgi:hypothetical protein
MSTIFSRKFIRTREGIYNPLIISSAADQLDPAITLIAIIAKVIEINSIRDTDYASYQNEIQRSSKEPIGGKDPGHIHGP